MFKLFSLSMAALFATSSLSWAGAETRLAAAERTGAQAQASAQSGEIIKHEVALEVAAELGVLEAQLKLARMYGSGEDVPLSHAKAFDFYQRIVDDHADIVGPQHDLASGMAHAFVALGNYYRTGIPGSAVKADKRRAAGLLWHAASYLADAEAQYELAQMYLDGEGVERNSRLAMNWLTNAAKKRHSKAQAILGDLLLRGARDVRRQPVKGLALLSLARQNARDQDETRWIGGLYAGAIAASQAHERTRAAILAERWQARMGRAGVLVSLPEQPKTEPAPAVADSGGTAIDSGVAASFTNVGMDGAGALR